MGNKVAIELSTERINDAMEGEEPFRGAPARQLPNMAQMQEDEIDALMDEALKAYDEGRIHSQEDAESLF